MAVQRDVVVIGASAGGVEALGRVVRQLPADFPAAVLVVLHLAPGAPTALPEILGRAGRLRAVAAADGAPLAPGTIYVAPPDRHLLLDDGTVTLTRGPTENGHRPAVNATFRSAALAAGPRVVGVVLSGTLHDGAGGLCTVVERGGLAVVQDPADALYPGMPESALARVRTEHVYPAEMLGKVLDQLVRQRVEPVAVPPPSPALLLDDRIARDGVGRSPLSEHAPASGYTCPDCHGALLENGDEPGHYRCRIGHAWTAEALLAARGAEFERALWTAVRSLEERGEIAERMKLDAEARGHAHIVRRYTGTARECSAAAGTLRRFLQSLRPDTGAER
ncbi:chemotaxis protein CheB [Amycolatopsis balhimycina DSM 5908]|uniref:protein-glutamate methylesterase n=1 Tax=Amycolatopsis balhimycina DSM 5908 TaxID=1081091 RepID=A0A428W3H5_AMYBA|nr:chemotaxis protein CheB [Amycolatopsis balhimycina]RSM37628.1 chemotaxis protein CheB [Amycolatopsis balhimycina DSM 5908]